MGKECDDGTRVVPAFASIKLRPTHKFRAGPHCALACRSSNRNVASLTLAQECAPAGPWEVTWPGLATDKITVELCG
jgi:hypothetical protein